MDGMDSNGIAQLTEVRVALPAPDLRSWIYFSTMSDFLKLYEESRVATQVDNAVPTLKVQQKKQTGNDEGN
jgi:hypothetical protein